MVELAAFHGAAVLNHARVIEVTRDGHGKVDGAIVQAGQDEIRVHAGVVVMATCAGSSSSG